MAEVVVLITAGSEDEAQRLAQALVQDGHAACVNVIPGIRSFFRWEGKIVEEREVLLVAKSRSELFESLSKKVKGIHSYDVPEIIALPIVDGAPDYLSWVREVTAKNE